MANLNEYLNQYIGKTSSEKLLFDASKYLIEEKLKKALVTPNEVCLVHVTNPLTKEITGIGGSNPDDLILDNLGIWLAVHWRAVNNTTTQISLIDKDGANNNVQFLRSVSATNQFNNTLSGGGGGRIQIGSGSTAPTRQDFSVDTPFIVSPEQDLEAVTLGILDVPNGTSKIQAFILAGGSGTIREAVQFFQWANLAGTDAFFAIARDLISPSVPFVIAQAITIEWTWQM